MIRGLLISLLWVSTAFTASAATNEVAETKMTLTQAIVLGVVEGLTEYLPVSSTGHLILAQRVMNIPQSDVADAFVLSIQIGAIFAVVGLFFPYVRKILAGLIGRHEEGQRLAVSLLIAFMPAALMGFFLVDLMTEYLFGLWPIVAAWWFGGMAILLVSVFYKKSDRLGKVSIYNLTWKHALTIGLIQCTAIWPGTSRSLVTIVGGILVGMEVASAVVFSFLLGAMTLVAVTVYEFFRHGTGMIEVYGLPNILIGIATAFVSAMIAVKWMVGYLQKHSLALFGWYRIILALVVLILLMNGVMESR